MRYYTRKADKDRIASCVQESGRNLIYGVLLAVICHRSSGLPHKAFYTNFSSLTFEEDCRYNKVKELMKTTRFEI